MQLSKKSFVTGTSKGRGLLFVLALTAALSLALWVHAARPSEDLAATVAALHRSWILTGWEYKASDGPFSFREKLGVYYDFSSPDVVLYDDFDPQHRIVRSAADYGAIWEPNFAALHSAHHRVALGPFVTLSGDLASSTLQFVARLEKKDGSVTGIRTLSSLVWRRGTAGWKIVREHNSSVIIPPAQLAAAMRED